MSATASGRSGQTQGITYATGILTFVEVVFRPQRSACKTPLEQPAPIRSFRLQFRRFVQQERSGETRDVRKGYASGAVPCFQ